MSFTILRKCDRCGLERPEDDATGAKDGQWFQVHIVDVRSHLIRQRPGSIRGTLIDLCGECVGDNDIFLDNKLIAVPRNR